MKFNARIDRAMMVVPLYAQGSGLLRAIWWVFPVKFSPRYTHCRRQVRKSKKFVEQNSVLLGKIEF